jgi:SAM-dependent methyltransferase
MTELPIQNTQRFSSRVDAYVAARPGYPQALASYLLDACALKAKATVADIGGGTGLSSRVLLNAGLRVIGVEPNDPMRRTSESLLAGYANFSTARGAAEATTLPSASVDFAFAGQAFHWFEAAAFRAELQRILKPGAQLALAWNIRAKTGPFTAAYDAVLQRFSEEYRNKYSFEDQGISLEEKHREKMAAVFGHAGWTARFFENLQSLDREGLVARANSASYAPPPGHADHQPMTQALYALFDTHQHAGMVALPMTTWLFHAPLH